MRTLTRALCICALAMTWGCPTSSGGDDDGGPITTDGGIDGAVPAECGDGVLSVGEACEPGLEAPCGDYLPGVDGIAGCTAECTLDLSACERDGVCGDGVINAGEGCDDGNVADGDGCSANCFPEDRPVEAFEQPCGTADRAVGGGPAGQPHPFCDAAITRDTFVPDPASPVAVRVKFHAIAQSARMVSITQAQLDVLIADTNRVLAAAGVTIVQEGALDVINDPGGGFFNLTRGDFDRLMGTNNDPNAVDVYLPSTFQDLCGRAADIGHPGGMVDGVASLPSCGGAVLAHELGHLFGLWHTHHDQGGEDNCSDYGDLLCDTAVDPGPPSAAPEGAGTCIDNSSAPGCTCMPGQAACAPGCAGGEMPDPFNTMSYYGCNRLPGVSRFSPEQASRMLCYLDSQFGYAIIADCQDADGDGYGFIERPSCPMAGSDCDDGAADVNPGAVETCDGRDEDCDGVVDEDLVRGCGEMVGTCQTGTQRCVRGAWGPCEGNDEPGVEVCDGLDNDCNGLIDDGLDDPLAVPVEDRCPSAGICAGGRAVNRCEGGRWICEMPEDWVETECAVTNAACGAGSLGDPTCNDGVDNDCDGVRDENSIHGLCVEHPNFDRVSSGQECFESRHGRCGQRGGTYECVQLAEECGVDIICAGATAPEPERCDGQDWDCDGHVGNRNDLDGDGYGDCGGRVDCDERRADVHPGAREVCNRTDDDCDGRIDEGVQNACGQCGPEPVEVCNGRDDNCNGIVDDVGPAQANACGHCGPVPREVCNGVDDDCDGRLDEDGPPDEPAEIRVVMSTRATEVREAFMGTPRDRDVFNIFADEARSGNFGCEGGCATANERTVLQAVLEVPEDASGPYQLCLRTAGRPEVCRNINPDESGRLTLEMDGQNCCNGILCDQNNSATFFATVRGIDACSSTPYTLRLTTSERCVP